MKISIQLKRFVVRRNELVWNFICNHLNFCLWLHRHSATIYAIIIAQLVCMIAIAVLLIVGHMGLFVA